MCAGWGGLLPLTTPCLPPYLACMPYHPHLHARRRILPLACSLPHMPMGKEEGRKGRACLLLLCPTPLPTLLPCFCLPCSACLAFCLYPHPFPTHFGLSFSSSLHLSLCAFVHATHFALPRLACLPPSQYLYQIKRRQMGGSEVEEAGRMEETPGGSGRSGDDVLRWRHMSSL